MRDDHRVSLDGAWDFQIDPNDISEATPEGEWRSVTVPTPWQAQFEDLRNTSGVALTGIIRLERSPALWSPDAPNLYTVTATLHVNGNRIHSIQKTCGFRTIEACDGRIHFNGNPIYLRGALDPGYYPEAIYTPSSLALLEAQARSAKALGFNCLRIHIKVEDPRYYEVADRLDLLVWTEIPNWALLTNASAGRTRHNPCSPFWQCDFDRRCRERFAWPGPAPDRG